MLVKRSFKMFSRILFQARKAFGIHTCNALRCFQKAFALRIFANAFKNQAGEALEKAGAVIDGFLEGLSGDDKEDAEKEEER